MYVCSGYGLHFSQLLVWNHSSTAPMQQYTDHLAAVKAIAWSPHQHGLLASGGGTADRCIRFWNTLTAQPLQCMDTGSQVCNLAWSKHANELVCTTQCCDGDPIMLFKL
jgi:cell division cycle 20-like protein 1 (cofactor of APC complex)